MRHTAAGLLVAAVALTGGAASGETYNVTLEGPNFVYDGQTNMNIDLTIQAGDTVLWTWVSGFHNVVSGTEGEPDEGVLFSSGDPTGAAGTTFEFTFNDVGLYDYHCEVHAGVGMVSQVRVVPTPASAALLAPGALLGLRRRRR